MADVKSTPGEDLLGEAERIANSNQADWTISMLLRPVCCFVTGREENKMEQQRTDQRADQFTPSATDTQRSVLGDVLQTLGVGQQHIDTVHQAAQSGDLNQKIDQTHQYVTDAINHARQYAQANPAAVLGGLSALVIAAGMMRNNLKR